MWYINYLVFLGLAVLFLLISLWKENNDFWNILSGFVSSILFLIISVAQLEIEIPYTAIQTNNTIITGTHTYTSSISVYLIYIFLGLFILLQIYSWVMVFSYYFKKNNPESGD